MKKYLYSLLVMFAVLAFASCQDDLEPNSTNVKSGLPAKLSLSIQVPSANKVVNSRGIYDYESEVTELALIMFEGGRKVFINLTGELETSTAPTEKGGRTYTLSKDIEGDELSGNYQVYAIANWSSPFCGMTLSQLESMSESDLEIQMATNANYVTSLSGTERLPMTYTGNVEIKSLEEDSNGTTLSIQLKRITSHIIFNFKNGTGKNQKFTPTSYTVYNLPKQAFLINRGEENNLIESGTKQYAHSSSIPVSGSEFEFFMLENVQNSGKSTSIADREEWTGDPGASPVEKTFSNAPQYSTFIVVRGDYSDDTHFGEVSYTIHLGNFSANPKNFTVNRNEKHTYTVTVNGVENIITEAKTDKEDQPGGEGIITEISKGSNFVLDAHYETIMLSFPLNDKCKRTKMSIRTPFDNNTYDLNEEGGNYTSADYQWVHFMKPTNTTTFPAYNENNVVNIVQFAQDLAEYAETGIYESDYPFMVVDGTTGTTVYTTAFVDEYFYEGKDWPTFVDQDNRVLVFNPAPATSKDENNIYYDDYIFQISQRSIKTIYAHNANINAFGIETWNETGKSYFGASDYSYDWNEASYGYMNTQTLISNAEVDFSKVGYFVAPSDNKRESHVFGSAGTYDGYLACMTRNRDLNADGKIDDTELKWYLPAVEQYTSIWLARDRLLEDTRLFTEEDMNDLSNDITSDNHWSKVNLWTSSTNGNRHRLYWPAEGASFGQGNDQMQGVRCVRNLFDTSGEVYSLTDGDTRRNENVILVNGASPASMRSTSMTGEYASGHTERQADNRLYAAFEVAENVIGNNSSSSAQNVTYYYQVDNIVRGSNWATLRAVNSSESKEYTFAVEVGSNGSVLFYETDGTKLGTEMSAQENAANGTITCSAPNNVSVTISTTLSKCDSYSGGYIITLYVVKESGYTYFFQGNSKSMTDEYTEENNTEGIRRFTIDEIKESNPCATLYSQSQDGSDLGQWRVPNQRELMLMGEYNYLTDASFSNVYASSTFFSKAIDLTKPCPFSFTGNITLDPRLSESLSFESVNFVIRCVRDASTSSSGQSTVNSLSGNGSYGTGGTLFE